MYAEGFIYFSYFRIEAFPAHYIVNCFSHKSPIPSPPALIFFQQFFHYLIGILIFGKNKTESLNHRIH